MLGLNVLLFVGLTMGSLAQYLDFPSVPQDQSLFYAVPKTCKIGEFTVGCCEGYLESADNAFLCIPTCEGGCSEHSVCTAPNICQCKYHAFRINNVCLPLCPRGHTSCLDGYCLGGDCVCPIAGHTGKYHCPATCRQPCPVPQTCIDKDTCGCENGFQLEAGTCKPYNV